MTSSFSVSKTAAITAVVITKNEAAGIGRCLDALRFCDQILVVDSSSTDATCDIAKEHGADVVQFQWNGAYPKKKQWGMAHPRVRNNWVLHIDGDEVVSPRLAEEISTVICNTSHAAFDLPLAYFFAGQPLKYGHRVWKRSLVDRRYSAFPEVGDLDAPGITEVEGHYQPNVAGTTARLNNRLVHDDPDPLGSWVARHNRYSDWEAYLRLESEIKSRVRGSRSFQGRIFDLLPAKPFLFFAYSYLIRLGILDGRAGFDYAYALAFYYWLIDAKTREIRRKN